MTDVDMFGHKWEEVKSYNVTESEPDYQVNWRWSRILGYHVPDTHDAI